MSKYEALTKQFAAATERLSEVIAMEKTDVVRDSAIQRFEICFDLAWKLIKAFLEEKKGVVCYAPKDCFREAYIQGLLPHDDFWMTMTDLRNVTTHTYNEKVAEEVWGIIPRAFAKFRELLAAVEK